VDPPDTRHETTDQKADDGNAGPAEHPNPCHTRATRRGAQGVATVTHGQAGAGDLD